LQFWQGDGDEMMADSHRVFNVFGARHSHVSFGSFADICSAKGQVRFSPNSDRESGFLQTLSPKHSVQLQGHSVLIQINRL